MAKKTEKNGADLVAAVPVAIDGRHFEAGEAIEGVDDEQVKICRVHGRVVTRAQFIAAAAAATIEQENDVPENEAPENEAGEPEGSTEGEPEA